MCQHLAATGVELCLSVNLQARRIALAAEYFFGLPQKTGVFGQTLLINCASTLYDLSDDALAKIQIFFSPPNATYEVIGTIAGSDEDYDDLIEDLQERTIKMGGNAFIVINQNSNSESSAMVGGVSGGAIIGGSSNNDKINYLVQVIT